MRRGADALGGSLIGLGVFGYRSQLRKIFPKGKAPRCGWQLQFCSTAATTASTRCGSIDQGTENWPLTAPHLLRHRIVVILDPFSKLSGGQQVHSAVQLATSNCRSTQSAEIHVCSFASTHQSDHLQLSPPFENTATLRGARLYEFRSVQPFWHFLPYACVRAIERAVLEPHERAGFVKGSRQRADLTTVAAPCSSFSRPILAMLAAKHAVVPVLDILLHDQKDAAAPGAGRLRPEDKRPAVEAYCSSSTVGTYELPIAPSHSCNSGVSLQVLGFSDSGKKIDQSKLPCQQKSRDDITPTANFASVTPPTVEHIDVDSLLRDEQVWGNISIAPSIPASGAGKSRELNRTVSLETSKVVLGIGRAIRSRANYDNIIQPLASLLNASVGFTRPGAEVSQNSLNDLIGQSGRSVASRLYIAIGISGATHHILGVRDAEVVIAINKDKSAAIFEIADYALCGDLLEVVPKLRDYLAKRLPLVGSNSQNVPEAGDDVSKF